LFVNAPELAKAGHDKVAQPLYAAVVRIARAQAILIRLGPSLVTRVRIARVCSSDRQRTHSPSQ